MQEQLMREEAVDEATEMSIEGISSPIAQHILDFCDDGGGADLFSIDGPSQTPAVSSVDVAGPSTTTTDALQDTNFSAAFSNFNKMDPDMISAIIESDLQPDQPQPQSQPQTQQQQQSVPSVNFNFLPPHPQSLNSTDFSTKEDNRTKAPEDMSNHASQFPVRIPPTSLMQVGPTQVRQQGGFMGIENPAFPLQIIQQNSTDPQRFFQSGNTSNGLAIPELEGMISPYSTTGREQLRRIFSSADMQVIRGSQNVMAACSESSATPVLATTEPSAAALEESSSYKVGRLTQEERKAKIDRYIRKRNERNFKKKIKYACRKTLADSRPRVRGRFAKNDEFEEPTRKTYSNGSYDDDGTSPMVPVKEDGDVLDSSDYPIQYSNMGSLNTFNISWSPDETWSV
ncbi:hypothetical protein LUZ62_015830 [Rhynchospora pubera]|uniref:CCT domain-containing protein n=1 Tax=Rhynchospora pubera TaxID=906938 RepID=A0AAV8E5C8_9POAL|nr:hypothetical protein LUZ62_058498 [Rhynchospora pubera]KAJ4803264.1 hypothetical protein LUZ62_015830 [Rhynchospora pubera]